MWKKLTLSTARIFAQIKTSKGLSSLALLCNNFKTYGKIPTLSARLTAHGPRSRKRPKSSNALNLCTWLNSTWRTIGSCSGGLRFFDPKLSHTWKAVSWSSKNDECTYRSSFSKTVGNCARHRSSAMSQACHIRCWKNDLVSIFLL